MSLHDTCMLCFLFSFLQPVVFLCIFLAKHSRFPWNYPLFPRFSDGFFMLTIVRTDKINAFYPSNIVEFWLFLPILAFLSFLNGFSDFDTSSGKVVA